MQNGAPLFALQALGGLGTERMVRRCAQRVAGRLEAYAGDVQIHGTIRLTSPERPETAEEKYPLKSIKHW